MMSIILWVIIGGLAGWIASMIMGTSARQSIFMDILLGIVGAIVGGFVMSMLGQPGFTGFDLYSLIVAVAGAVVLIALGRAIYRV